MFEKIMTLVPFIGWGFMFFIVIEFIGTHVFSPTFMPLGFKVYKKNLRLDFITTNMPINQVIKKAEGKFKFISKREVFFLSQIFWFKFFRFNTPFPLKGVATIRPDNQVHIVARIPFGVTLLFGFIVTASITGAIYMMLQSKSKEPAIFIIVSFLIFSIFMIIGFIIEKSRMDTMVKELEILLTNP